MAGAWSTGTEFATFLLQCLVVIFSMLAGMFWMSSASTSSRIVFLFWPPWRKPKLMMKADDPFAHQAYQAKRNNRAAFLREHCSIAQAILFAVEKYPSSPTD
jgi:hypothetical protein